MNSTRAGHWQRGWEEATLRKSTDSPTTATASKLRAETEREAGGGKTGMPASQGLRSRASAALWGYQRPPRWRLLRSV